VGNYPSAAQERTDSSEEPQKDLRVREKTIKRKIKTERQGKFGPRCQFHIQEEEAKRNTWAVDIK